MIRRRRLRAAAMGVRLPEDALPGGGPRVTMIAQGCVLVEGQRGVVELSPFRVRLRTGSGVVSVCGAALVLRELSADSATITGEPVVTVTYGKAEGGT